MKNIVIYLTSAILIFLGFQNMSAQERYFDERYIFSQSIIHPTLINPGATAHHRGQELLVNYRNMWATFPGSPKTVALSYDGVVSDRLGFGALFLQDSYAGLQTTKGQVSLSYTIVSDKNQVGFGLAAEYIQHRLKNSALTDQLIDLNDQLFLQRADGTSFIDATFGIYGKYNNQLTYGISFPSLISSRVDGSTSDASRSLGVILNLGYKMQLQSSGISFEPGLLLKKLNNVPTHVQLNAKFGFLDDKFTGGLMYTLGGDKVAGFLLGFGLERLNFYYTYNVSSQSFQDYNNGAHEFSVLIKLGSLAPKTAVAPAMDKM